MTIKLNKRLSRTLESEAKRLNCTAEYLTAQALVSYISIQRTRDNLTFTGKPLPLYGDISLDFRSQKV